MANAQVRTSCCLNLSSFIYCGFVICITAKQKKRKLHSDDSSTISTTNMERIVAKLMAVQHRDSTAKNYLSIWRQFNKFMIRLARKPRLWEDRTTLFVGFLIEKGM